MKEVVKDAGQLRIKEFTEKAFECFWHLGISFLGIFMSKTTLTGGIMPFGAMLTAGVPVKYIPAASIGSILGYIIPFAGVSSFRYTAAILAISIIRLITNSIKGVGEKSIWSFIIASSVLSLTGIVSSDSSFFANGVTSISEGVIAGGGAYFINNFFKIKRKGRSESTEDTASLLITLCIVITSLFPFNIDGISVGRIMSYTFIMYAAKYGRVGTSSVAGIASATALTLWNGDMQSALIFCMSGLVSGILSGFGKVPVACAPVAVSAIWIMISYNGNISMAMLAESFIAAIIFIIIPKTATANLHTIMSPPAITPDTDGLRRTLTMRLGFAATALKGVSETVEDVSKCLALTKKPNFAEVLYNVENDACKGCSFHMYCWEKQSKTVADTILGMSDAIRKCQPLTLAEIPDEFREKCLRIERFEDSVSKYYSEYQSKVEAEKRVTEMRDVVSEQINGIADMLNELSDEFRTAQNYDVSMAGRVALALKDLDICPDECSCVVDKFGRMTVEIRLLRAPEVPVNRAKILAKIEEVCEKDFEPPQINRAGRSYYITATEKAVYSADCGLTQFNQGTNQLCGDTCSYFYDGRGRMVAIISDGMGSGGRAAVDSGMTAGLAERLIKAGFGYNCALKIVNSAMMFKSTDESLATLDISCIDLYNGKTEIFKAGAAPTIVRRNGRTGKAECKSLPAGILNQVGFDKAVVTLSEGDIIVMMSDGVNTDGTDWICEEIENWKDGGAKQLSERIASSARRRRSDGHEDDITVFAAILEKAI